MLMPGKQSLYQRVLARPGAVMSKRPKRAAGAKKVVPFTVFYVYARETAGDTEWIHVGTNSHGHPQGWVPASQLLPWNQALTVAFREPVEQDRVLLFRDRESLKSLVKSRDMETYARLYQGADKGERDDGSPIIAIQPNSYIDIKEDFYLVPIQQHEDIYFGGEQALMLKVASVPLKAESAPAERGAYRSGLVFLIDSTVSMGPYIDRTREVVRKVYRNIANAGLEDKVNFGLVAYRDNTGAAPGLGFIAAARRFRKSQLT